MVRMINFLRLMQLVSRAIRLVIPWVARLIIFMISYIATTLVALWGNFLPTVRRTAEEWQSRAILSGIPTEYDVLLYWIFYAVAFGMILFGWIVMSFLTITLIHLIF